MHLNLNLRLISKGVTFLNQKVTTLKDFVAENSNYDVIFNCLGLGAITFCDDQKLVSMRGQMIRVFTLFYSEKFYFLNQLNLLFRIGECTLDQTFLLYKR